MKNLIFIVCEDQQDLVILLRYKKSRWLRHYFFSITKTYILCILFKYYFSSFHILQYKRFFFSEGAESRDFFLESQVVLIAIGRRFFGSLCSILPRLTLMPIAKIVAQSRLTFFFHNILLLRSQAFFQLASNVFFTI